MRSLGAVVAVFVVLAVLFGIALPVGWSLIHASNDSGTAPQPKSAAFQTLAQPGDAERGRMVYLSWCQGCHAPEAKVGPSFASESVKAKYRTADALIKVIRSGRHPMPAFSPDQVNDQAAADLVAYIGMAK